MNYSILNSNSKPAFGTQFFTTDRTVGRDPELLCPLVGVEKDRFARPHQTHTDSVLRVDEAFFLLPTEEREAKMEGIDAVISDVKDACLGISTADCIPVLVHDKEHNAAAAIHAGWRGTQKRIVTKALSMMKEAYNTRPEQCEAVIGPGISLRSFEVGQEVYDAFATTNFPMQGVAEKMPNAKTGEMKWHIDLKEINRRLLLDASLKAENIQVNDVDTFTNESFFSARREQTGQEKCGRILSGFVLRPHPTTPSRRREGE